MNNEVVPTNGQEPLPDHQLKAIETGLATYQVVVKQRNDLDNKLHDANLHIEKLTVQLDSLRSVVEMMESTYSATRNELESRVRSYQEERDVAVSRAASLLAVLHSARVVLENVKSQE